MATRQMKVAQLDDARLSKLQDIERDLGTCVVAVEKNTQFAELSEEQLNRLQAGEKELGVILLAYECN